MDTREPLASIAKTLPALPEDTVESTLLTFDTLVHFGDPGTRGGWLFARCRRAM